MNCLGWMKHLLCKNALASNKGTDKIEADKIVAACITFDSYWTTLK